MLHDSLKHMSDWFANRSGPRSRRSGLLRTWNDAGTLQPWHGPALGL